MRGLTIIVADAEPGRLRTALMLALAQTALGGRAHVFCDGPAVKLLRLPIGTGDDAIHEAAGLPSLGLLVEEALADGVGISLCQTGLQLARVEAEAFDPRFRFGGMIGLLTALGDDRLVAL